MGLNRSFWKNKNVFLTGHTGFKGAWMTMLLTHLGAKVTGFSLQPITIPNLFDKAKVVDLLVEDYRQDIANLDNIKSALQSAEPDIVIHMAAQSLVIESYHDPVTTFATNIMGTINVLEAIRSVDSIQSGLMITTDKCYENKESVTGYTEQDRLGGLDPYSNSKACAELAISSYQSSFFSTQNSVQIASARAGNVIGGGDWSVNRLIPDCVKAFSQNKQVDLRSPNSIRPWQHVLEPLSGYLLLIEKLHTSSGKFNSAWNFGPNSEGEVDTRSLVDQVAELWGDDAGVIISNERSDFAETGVLKLDSSKARKKLHWQPRWNIQTMLEKTVEWYKYDLEGKSSFEITNRQIDEYLS